MKSFPSCLQKNGLVISPYVKAWHVVCNLTLKLSARFLYPPRTVKENALDIHIFPTQCSNSLNCIRS